MTPRRYDHGCHPGAWSDRDRKCLACHITDLDIRGGEPLPFAEEVPDARAEAYARAMFPEPPAPRNRPIRDVPFDIHPADRGRR